MCELVVKQVWFRSMYGISYKGRKHLLKMSLQYVWSGSMVQVNENFIYGIGYEERKHLITSKTGMIQVHENYL